VIWALLRRLWLWLSLTVAARRAAPPPRPLPPSPPPPRTDAKQHDAAQDRADTIRRADNEIQIQHDTARSAGGPDDPVDDAVLDRLKLRR
jgi:hypothetical protein